MLRTASIRLCVAGEQITALGSLRAAYADACNRLVPIVQEHRCWNRVDLHKRAYSRLRAEKQLGSQMTCNAIFAVCKAYKAQRALGRIDQKDPIPAISFESVSVHYDKRTYRLIDGRLSLYTLRGRILNHETSKAIVAEAVGRGVATIAIEDLTHIRDRIKAGKRVRARLHRWAFRQLQSFIEYKARAIGIRVVYVDPAYTSQTCSCCGNLGRRERLRFLCGFCGLRAHADLNASRNLARIGGTAVLPRAAVNTPDVGNVGYQFHVSQ